MEHSSEHAESSQNNTEYHSKSGTTESEEGSTASEEDTFLSIQYPSSLPLKNFPLQFHKPYLHNQDFKDSDQALRYIMKNFNLELIHQSVQSFPDLSNNFIYSNTYMDTHQFTQLQLYK